MGDGYECCCRDGRHGRRFLNGTEELMRDVILLIRPSHWIKNIALLAGLIFSKNFFNFEKVWLVIAAFFIFSLASSSVYIINDIFDADRDKIHPVKKSRPIASGRIRIRTALFIASFLALAALLLSAVLNPLFMMFVAAYIAIEVFYSITLKNIVILDIFCIASGFLIRVICGAVVINVPVSSWLLICSIFLALFLALSKRRSEMLLFKDNAGEHRPVLANYSLIFIDQMITVVSASAIVCYCLYTASETTVAKFHTRDLGYTIPFVVYGVFRYLYLVYKEEKGGAPERLIVSDKPLLLNLILYIIVAIVAIYT